LKHALKVGAGNESDEVSRHAAEVGGADLNAACADLRPIIELTVRR
jgi:hypothetical protein